MKRSIRLMILLLMPVFLLACGLESMYWDVYLDGKTEELSQGVGTDDTPVTFTIESGQSVDMIAGNLQAHGLISDSELFANYVQAKGLDAGIQAGTYTLNKTMTIPEIAQKFQQATAEEQTVTIPEGKRLEEVSTMIAEQTNIDAAEFMQLAQTGWQGSSLVTDHPILSNVPVTATLEGFLMPDTYRLPIQASAMDLVERMVSNMERQLTPEMQQGFAAHGLSVYEGIVLASIVEREAVLDHERPIIAGVYHNRLRDGWPLSACPTVQYALGFRPEENSWWKSMLYFVDLEIDSPYNTYRKLGLPPAPIASPGIAAIEASALPAETHYYFFMVDCAYEDSRHVFSENEAQHLENYNRCGGVYTAP